MAIVVDDLDATLDRVRSGHEVEETRKLWGARRAFAIAPGGHRVELMEAPPPSRRAVSAPGGVAERAGAASLPSMGRP